MKAIFLSYGDNEQNHYRTYFAILTFMNNTPSFDGEVVLYTSDAQFFESLSGVTIKTHDQKKVQKDIDEFDYIHFFKLDILCSQKDSFMFFDSDTFVLGNFQPMIDLIKPGTIVMYEAEYYLRDNPAYRPYLKDCDPRIRPETIMYNSGFLGIHKKDLGILSQAPVLVKRILKHKHVHTAEQFALSALFQDKCELKTARSHMLHYWDKKEEFDPKVKNIVDAHKNENKKG